MSAHEAWTVLIEALLTATTVGLLLSLIPVLHADRKGFFNRFGYFFLNYGLPCWLAFEFVLWLAKHRWIP